MGKQLKMTWNASLSDSEWQNNNDGKQYNLDFFQCMFLLFHIIALIENIIILIYYFIDNFNFISHPKYCYCLQIFNFTSAIITLYNVTSICLKKGHRNETNTLDPLQIFSLSLVFLFNFKFCH